MAALAAGALAFGGLCGYALRDAGVQLSTTGPEQDAFLGPRATEDLVFRVTSDLPTLMETATLEYDGADVRDDAFVGDGELTYRPQGLEEGTHTLRFTIDQPLVPWRATRSWTFTVDHTRPDIEITGPTRPAVREAPVTMSGRVNEPSTVTVNDAPVDVGADGRFSVTFPEPPAGKVAVRAVDRAGNSKGIRTTIPAIAREPLVPIRAVHMTAISWETDYLREPVLELLRDKKINAIELDLKDESGMIGYDSKLPFANKIGAVEPSYVVEDAVRQIHDLGGRVIGRIVAFRDPVHAKWAWDHGARDQVIQTPEGQPYAGYGGFTNFADPTVRDYNIDVAEEAARRGVDDILYDYIRRPDGPLETMKFPVLEGRRAGLDRLVRGRRPRPPRAHGGVPRRLAVRHRGLPAGGGRPGRHAHRAQRRLRRAAGVPSHWNRGVYGVDEPESEPRAIVEESLVHFNELVKNTGARVVPWLQDFSLRVTYGPTEVCAQVEGARAEGVSEWIMWDPNVTYTGRAASGA